MIRRHARSNRTGRDAIDDVTLRTTVSCGVWVDLDGFKAANEVLREMSEVERRGTGEVRDCSADASKTSPSTLKRCAWIVVFETIGVPALCFRTVPLACPARPLDRSRDESMSWRSAASRAALLVTGAVEDAG